jgi:hypothetical protein
MPSIIRQGTARAGYAILPLSEAGLLSAENGASSPADTVIDVSGYFR